MRSRSVAPLLSLTLAAVLSGGCTLAPESAADGSGSAPRQIVLISLDTVRPDHLGIYGYDRPTSPTIDQFAARAVVFDDAVAQASSTLSSHASILTSRIPRHHGASFARKQALSRDVPTLAELLREAGYRTAAVTGGGQLDRRFGVGRGFEEYQQARFNQNFGQTVGLGIKWLRKHREEKVFLFLHTYQPHHPYAAVHDLHRFESDYDGPLPEIITFELLQEINSGRRPIDERDRQHIVNAYDADLRATDEGFGRLQRFLRRQGLLRDALIVLTSDHGEELGEHGHLGWHGHTLYEELIRIPLIVKLPGNARGGTRVASSVRGLDIGPTILDLAGVPIPESFQGVSLRPHLAGAVSEDLPAVSELDAIPTSVSYRRRPWKLEGGRLFDLTGDPLESRDVTEARGSRLQQLTHARESWLALLPAPAAERVELDEDTLEQLESLGYVTSSDEG